MNPAKWLQPPTSTTELTHSILLARLVRSCFIKNAPRFARRRIGNLLASCMKKIASSSSSSLSRDTKSSKDIMASCRIICTRRSALSNTKTSAYDQSLGHNREVTKNMTNSERFFAIEKTLLRTSPTYAQQMRLRIGEDMGCNSTSSFTSARMFAYRMNVHQNSSFEIPRRLKNSTKEEDKENLAMYERMLDGAMGLCCHFLSATRGEAFRTFSSLAAKHGSLLT